MQICIQELSSSLRAEGYLKQAMACVPSDIATLRSLRELYLGRGNYEPGAQAYEMELARIEDPADKVAGLIKLARIYRDHLGRLDKALSTLLRVRSSGIRPTCAPR